MQRPETTARGHSRINEILQATREVVSEKGFDRTTMRDIGNKAGLSAALVVYYFQDKATLMKETLLGALRAHRQTLEEAIADERMDPMEKLRVVVNDLLPHDEESSREWRFWLDYWAECTRHEELRGPMAESIARLRVDLQQVIEQGAAAGAFRRDLATQALATQVSSLINGLSVTMMLDPGSLTPEAATDTVLSIVRKP